jgi:DsbE subfamily thiol:disulfide oxidoreductase
MSMRRWLVLAPLAIFVVLLGLFAVRLAKMERGDMPNDIKTVLIDKPAPEFQLPPLLMDKPGLASGDLVGKVTLVNFFASWCIPCRAEHPLLSQLKGQVAVVGIAYKNDAADARGWLAALGDPYDAIALDRDGRVAIDFGVYGVPESYLIDRAGRIRYAWKKPFTPQEIRTTLLPLVAELNK